MNILCFLVAIMAMDSKPTVPSRSEISLVSSSAFSPKGVFPVGHCSLCVWGGCSL